MTIGRELARAGAQRTGDMMMGLAGGCLAVASASFGVYMTVRGPSPDFGKNTDFTVFAQLAPRANRGEPLASVDRPGLARQASPPSSQDLDLTATGSIPKVVVPPDTNQGAIIPSASVEVATGKAATIRIDGRVRTVRVGDSLPGAGDVLAIFPGIHPSVKTTRGTIISRDDD